jgi:RNA polymerase sigma factor (sigma-70 family)
MTNLFHDDLERLLGRCRNGSAEAWQTLVDRFKSVVYSVPRRHGLGPDDSADVFQTTFQRLYSNLDRIDTPNALPRWLISTATHESLRLKRAQQRENAIPDPGQTLDETVDQDERTAEQELIDAMEALQLRRAVEALPSRCRELIAMLYLDDEASYLEVGERMAMPIGSIGPTRARCLEKLRRILVRDGFFE